MPAERWRWDSFNLLPSQLGSYRNLEDEIYSTRCRCGVFTGVVCHRSDFPKTWWMPYPWMCLPP